MEINTVDARIATLIVNVCNVLGTRYIFLSFAPHNFCCPPGKGQGSRVNPSWVVPEPAFSTTAHPPAHYSPVQVPLALIQHLTIL